MLGVVGSAIGDQPGQGFGALDAVSYVVSGQTGKDCSEDVDVVAVVVQRTAGGGHRLGELVQRVLQRRFLLETAQQLLFSDGVEFAIEKGAEERVGCFGRMDVGHGFPASPGDRVKQTLASERTLLVAFVFNLALRLWI